MGTINLIIFSLVIVIITYLVEKYRHTKMMFENLLVLHSQERYTIEYLSSLISEQYPVLATVATSMTHTSEQYNSQRILNHVKTVDAALRAKLKNEIKDIINNNDNDNAKTVLRWYMIACKLVEYAERNKKIEISLSEESRKISKNEFDQEDYDNTFCMA